MRILFLGDDHPLLTSGHRAAALRRLGHEVTVLNPSASLPRSRIVGGLSTRVGLWPFVPWVDASLRRKIGQAQFELTWVDCGPELGPGFHRWLRERGMKIVNYNVDDPFGPRDGHKWDLYRRSVRFHDVTAVVRQENVKEAEDAGARRILHVFRSYDPVAHAPLPLNDEERRAWQSDVIFVGSWMPERGPFMVRLLDAGVPLTIRGDHWEKAPEYERLRSVIRGQAIYGPDYVRAIQCAKVALGLLSKGNRDLHTQRSAEVPFIGGAVFCAERTIEHETLFQDGVDALLWRDSKECAQACAKLLADEIMRDRMARSARARIVGAGLSNDLIAARILSALQLSESSEGLSQSMPPFATRVKIRPTDPQR